MAGSNLLVRAVNRIGLVQQVVIGLTLDIALAVLTPQTGIAVRLLGSLFVGALKTVTPILAFTLVLAAIAQHQKGNEVYIKPIIILYLIGTFSAALVAMIANFVFPTMLIFSRAGDMSATPSGGVVEMLKTLLISLVSSPTSALADANYIGILAWTLILDFIVRNHGSDATRQVVTDTAETVSTMVKWVIRFAPLDTFGLVSSTITETGFGVLKGYMHLLAMLLGSTIFIALVVNPLIVWWKVYRNPYPLVFTRLREDGMYAFFTHSPAASIPVDVALAKKLGLHEDTYSIAIPLEATINTAGAAITITMLAMAATHTQHIQVDFFTVLLLSLVAAISACGTSDVTGSSLLLVPLARSLFGISNDVAMQMIAIDFIIGMIQDSTETTLNSSTDVLLTATVDLGRER